MSQPWRCAKAGCVHPNGCHGHSSRTGNACRRSPVVGSTVCRTHGGAAPQVKAKAVERVVEAEVREAVTRLGVPVEVDPGEALMTMVYEAAGNVAFLRSLVAQLPEHDLYGPLAYEKPKAEPHVLVRMYDAERDRLAQVCALALKAGIDERRLRLAESEVERLYDAVVRAMTVLPAQHREPFRVALANELRA